MIEVVSNVITATGFGLAPYVFALVLLSWGWVAAARTGEPIFSTARDVVAAHLVAGAAVVVNFLGASQLDLLPLVQDGKRVFQETDLTGILRLRPDLPFVIVILVATAVAARLNSRRELQLALAAADVLVLTFRVTAFVR